MPLSPEEVKKLATLARLQFCEEEIPAFTARLSAIVSMVEQMEAVDTSQVPDTCLLNKSQRLREDEVTVPNLRELYQSIAPDVMVGLYLVPKVIE